MMKLFDRYDKATVQDNIFSPMSFDIGRSKVVQHIPPLNFFTDYCTYVNMYVYIKNISEAKK